MSSNSKRQLAAILFSDIVGYTALMQINEQQALTNLQKFKQELETKVPSHKGEIIQFYGDGCLAIFNSSVEAVSCAKELQEAFEYEPTVPVRIGLHLGDVLFKEGNVFGDAVNIASRVESMGIAGAVLISSNVRNQIKNKQEFQLVSLGRFEFKNVEGEMTVYALANEGFPIPESGNIQGKFKVKPTASWKKGKSHWLALAVLGIFLLFIGVWFSKNQFSKGDFIIDNSIAVLPFDNYSSSKEHQFFANAVADEIRSQLLGIKNLKVISGYSSKHYKGLNLSSHEIGKELGVSYILKGNVQRFSNSIKVSVELSNTQTDKLEWAPPPFERSQENIFQLENEIANKIVSQLSIQLSNQEQSKLDQKPTENAQAYEAFLLAQEYLQRGKGGLISELDQAVHLFKEAIALDPNFDRAHLGLAAAYMEYAFWGRLPSKETVDKALDAVFKVSNTESGEYYGILGAINFYRFKKQPAEDFLEKALGMSSNYLGAYVRLAYIKTYEGKFDEALKLLDVAHSRDPKSLMYDINKMWVYYFSHEYDQSIEVLEGLLSEHPNDNLIKWSLGNLYAVKGEYDKAISVFQSRTIGQNTNWMLGYAFARAGKTEKARAVLNYLLERRQHGHVPAHMIATVYTGLGEDEKAMDWLERDVEEGGHGLLTWGRKMDAKFDPLRKYERYRKLIDVIQ